MKSAFGKILQNHTRDTERRVMKLEKENAVLVELAGELMEAMAPFVKYLITVKDAGPQWDRYQSDGMRIRADTLTAVIAKAQEVLP